MLTVFQQRTGCDTFSHESLTLKYKLDNEFELVFVVFIILFFDNVCVCACVNWDVVLYIYIYIYIYLFI